MTGDIFGVLPTWTIFILGFAFGFASTILVITAMLILEKLILRHLRLFIIACCFIIAASLIGFGWGWLL